jgi:hypothetical protein
MNETEKQMYELLVRGRDHHGVVAVKAEFESEGTRPDEFLRLFDLARRANLKIALKIGGCEAVSDLLASRLYSVDYVVAPMVETPYALSKFSEARHKTYPEPTATKFLFNLETDTTFGSLPKLAEIARGKIDGIVFGRVDYTLSKGMPRTGINERVISDAVIATAEACRCNDLELVVGGAVTKDSISVLREVQAIRLDRYETRKVIFDGAAINDAHAERGIANAADFELLWLKNKRSYYHTISIEDAKRIDMLEARATDQRFALRVADRI